VETKVSLKYLGLALLLPIFWNGPAGVQAADRQSESQQANPAQNAVSQYNLGLTHHQTGELDAAATAYAQALRLDPDLRQASYNLGLLYLQSKQLDKAQAVVSAALKRWLVDPDLHALAGQLAAATDQPQAAQAAYQRAVMLQPDHLAAQWLEAPPTQTIPVAAQQAYHRGQTQYEQGQYPAALASLQAALQLVPDWDNAHYLLGLIQARNQQVPAAQAAWQSALKHNPEHIGSLQELAQLASNPQTAEACWQQIANIRPRFSRAYAELAQLAEARGDHALGARWRAQLHQLSPKWPENNYYLARYAYWQGQLEQAIAYLNPADGQLSQAAHLLLSEIALRQGQPQAAQTWLQNALTQWPDSAQVQTQLARYWLAQAQPKQARHYLALALGQAQPPAAAYALRAQLALQEGETERGLLWFQAALKREASLQHYRWLIFAQLQAGRQSEALSTLNAAIQAFPQARTELDPQRQALQASLKPGKGRW